MFEIIMYLGLVGIIISIFMMLIIPNIQNTLTNGVDSPRIVTVGILLFTLSVFASICGAFLSSEPGRIVINAIK